MAPAEEVPLKPPLTEMLGEDLHHAPPGRDLLVVFTRVHEASLLALEDRTEPVRVGLIGTEQPEAARVVPIDRRQHVSERPGRLDPRRASWARIRLQGLKSGKPEGLEQAPAVRVRARAHALVRGWGERSDHVYRCAAVVEVALWPIAAHPCLELREVRGILPHPRERHLV